MNIADLIKETTTSTSTAAITLAGAATGFRSFASGLGVGVASIPVKVGPDSAGAWLEGYYTLTDATTLTRTRIIDSSAAGADVILAAGSKSVSCVVTAAMIRSGMVDPDDAGFDIILCVGQSNMAGRGTLDSLIDIADARVWQYGCATGQSRYRTIFSGADPLHMEEGVATAKVGPATAFARAYASTVPANRQILLLPLAHGGTSLVHPGVNGYTPAAWAPGNPGGALYENTITQANLAVTAAQALFPNSRVVGAIWVQGESDGDNNITQVAYAAALKALIAGFRSRITGASNAWFVIGGMCPEVISSFSGYGPIDLAHKQVANEVSKCAFAAGPTGQRADTWHYTAQGARILGGRMALAVRSALYNPGVDLSATTLVIGLSSASTVVGSPVTVTVGTDSPLTGSQSQSVTLVAPVAGTWSANPVTLNASTPTAAPTFTPSAAGSGSITASASGTPTIAGASAAYAATAAATVPGAPTIGTATAGDGTVSVAFTAPASNGGAAITSYTATLYKVSDNTAAGSASGASSPIAVTAVNGTAVYAKVKATNSVGTGAESAASNNVTPAAASSGTTWSPTDKHTTWSLSNGNLTATNSGAVAWSSVRASAGKSSGKWYWEVTYTGSNRAVIGVGTSSAALSGGFVGADANGIGWYSNGTTYRNNVGGTVILSFAAGDVLGVALDVDARTVEFYKNGTKQTQAAFTSLPAGTLFPMVSSEGNGYAFTLNPNPASPPAGFTALG
jgi:hypothetical protein